MNQLNCIPVIFVALFSIGLSSKDLKEVTGSKGKSIKLKCNLHVSNPPSLMWVDFVYNSSPEPQIIFDSVNNPGGIIDEFHPNRAHYDVSSDFTLTIRDLSIDRDAGRYECRSRANDTTVLTKKYELTVAAKPTCHTNSQITDDSTKLICQSDYSGNHYPQLEWFSDGQLLESIPDLDIRLSRQVLTVERAMENNGKTYRCVMTLEGQEEQCDITLNVQYHARAMHMTKEKEFFHVGEEIFCSAQGNPIPEVILRSDLGDESKGRGETTMSVPHHWRGKEISVTCIAHNHLNKHPHEKTIQFSVTDNISTRTTTIDNRPKTKNQPLPKEVVGNSANLSLNNNQWWRMISTITTSLFSVSFAFLLLH